MTSLWLALSLVLAAPALAQAEPLIAGVARVDITPPLALQAALGGYGARMSRPATGIHDRVWAKALVVRQGARRFALVTADLLAFPPGFKSAVVAGLAPEGWQDAEVMLLASHSHASLDMQALNPQNTFHIPQLGVFHPALYQRTRDLFIHLIQEAARNPQPCKVGTTSLLLEGWSRNRRAGNTTIQPELTVTRVDTAQGPLAVLVNWTAHPTFLAEEDMLFSGDWPGQMQRTVEALIGGQATVLYYNGAEGDQSPVPRPDSGGNWEKAERYGRELGVQVWKLWQQIRPQRAARLAYHMEPIALPPRTWHPDFMRTGGTEYGLDESRVREIVERLAPVATHSISLRLGDLVIAGVPGELAAALGDEVKARVRQALGVRHVVIGGLADEWTSYILSPEEYRKGGYEASMCFYGEGLGPVIVEGVARGAATLRSIREPSADP